MSRGKKESMVCIRAGLLGEVRDSPRNMRGVKIRHLEGSSCPSSSGSGPSGKMEAGEVAVASVFCAGTPCRTDAQDLICPSVNIS